MIMHGPCVWFHGFMVMLMGHGTSGTWAHAYGILNLVLLIYAVNTLAGPATRTHG
jgi:hypothetical protein